MKFNPPLLMRTLHRRATPILTGVLLVSASLPLFYAIRALACTSDDMKAVGTEIYFPLAYGGERPTAPDLVSLGRALFFDRSLSATGKLSCASCHAPDHAYGPPGKGLVPAGGLGMDRTGFRNTPSLTYVHAPVAFTEHFLESNATGTPEDEGPTGGHTWDGRVNTAHEQALMPLVDPNEMANADRAAVVERLRQSPLAAKFREVVNPPEGDVFDDPDAVIGWLTVALEAFEQTPSEFHPFTSKFDAWLRDETTLTAQEQRGMGLFNDMKKGNCASCHTSTRKSAKDRPPLFTDFGFVVTGAPRNRALPVNANPAFFDLGLCGPLRSDLKGRAEFCGAFRTPSLRNVALRPRFFHNGVFGSLREVMDFYVTRDTDPGRWYPHGNAGRVEKYDDLPATYHENVTHEVPFLPLPGNRPRLSPSEIEDIIAFLNTLTDGWKPAPASRAALAGRRTAALP